MYGRNGGLFDARDSWDGERSFEESVFVNLHAIADKLKEEDRGELIKALDTQFEKEMPLGFGRFKEIEQFKQSMRTVIEPFMKKIPKKKTRVVEVEEESWL